MGDPPGQPFKVGFEALDLRANAGHIPLRRKIQSAEHPQEVPVNRTAGIVAGAKTALNPAKHPFSDKERLESASQSPGRSTEHPRTLPARHHGGREAKTVELAFGPSAPVRKLEGHHDVRENRRACRSL